MQTNVFTEPIQQDVISLLRIRAVQVLLFFIFTASVLLTIATGMSTTSIANLFVAGITAAALFSVHTGRNVRFIGTVAVLYLAFISILTFTGDFDILIILLLLTTIGAAIISPPVVFWLVNAISIGATVWFIAFSGELGAEAAETESATLAYAITIILALLPPILGVMLRYFVDRLEQVARNAQRTATLLEASANIGKNVSQMLELEELLNRSVEIVRDRFAFYHVQIFLLDDEQHYAYLQASTGEVGQQMLARGHRLRVDSNSVIGRVALSGEPISARDTDRDEGHSFNELLPDTRSELAIPIKDSDGMIGALDVQSRLVNAFTANEIRVLNVIANQLATAIRNARLFEKQAQSVRENKRLFIEAETSLRENQRLNRQLTKDAWADYLKADRRISGVTLQGQDFRNRADWSPEMLQSSQRRRPITVNTDDKTKIAVPIQLRGEVVGAIEIESVGKQDESAIDMLQAISQRLAVSVDNARLFEETQEATAQEQRVGELVSHYQTANTVDDLLKLTLEGLMETLGAETGSIRLGRLPEIADTTTTDANGHSHNEHNGGTPA